MYKGKTVGVVVPAYNEEGFVGEVIDTIPTFVDRVYLIDDCSTDGTWAEIRRHVREAERRVGTRPIADGGMAAEPRFVTIRHEENRGVGGCIKTGYRRAYEDDVDVTAVMNGDGQMDPDILNQIIDPVVEEQADYAKGNRLLNPDHRRGMSAWRFFGNTLLTVLTKIASGYWRMMDPQNGYTAISREAIDELPIDGMYEDYGFCNDILVKLNALDMRVADVAMPAVYGDEESGIRYSTFVPNLSFLLLRDFLWRLRTKYLIYDFHPLALFYYVGATGCMVSVLYATWSAVDGATVLEGGIAVLILLLSTVLLLFAMVFDKMDNANLEIRIEGDP